MHSFIHSKLDLLMFNATRRKASKLEIKSSGFRAFACCLDPQSNKLYQLGFKQRCMVKIKLAGMSFNFTNKSVKRWLEKI